MCSRTARLPLQEPDNRGHGVLGGNREAPMHMAQLQMPFDNLAFLLPGQGMKNRPELGTDLPDSTFRRRLGINTTWYLQSHFEWDRL